MFRLIAPSKKLYNRGKSSGKVAIMWRSSSRKIQQDPNAFSGVLPAFAHPSLQAEPVSYFQRLRGMFFDVVHYRSKPRAGSIAPTDSDTSSDGVKTPPSEQVLDQPIYPDPFEDESFTQFYNTHIKDKPALKENHIYVMRYLVDILYMGIHRIFPHLPFESEADHILYSKLLKNFEHMRTLIVDFSEKKLLDETYPKKLKDKKNTENVAYVAAFRAYFDALTEVIVPTINKHSKSCRGKSLLLLTVHVAFLSYHVNLALYGENGGTSIAIPLLGRNEVEENHDTFIYIANRLNADLATLYKTTPPFGLEAKPTAYFYPFFVTMIEIISFEMKEKLPIYLRWENPLEPKYDREKFSESLVNAQKSFQLRACQGQKVLEKESPDFASEHKQLIISSLKYYFEEKKETTIGCDGVIELFRMMAVKPNRNLGATFEILTTTPVKPMPEEDEKPIPTNIEIDSRNFTDTLKAEFASFFASSSFTSLSPPHSSFDDELDDDDTKSVTSQVSDKTESSTPSAVILG